MKPLSEVRDLGAGAIILGPKKFENYIAKDIVEIHRRGFDEAVEEMKKRGEVLVEAIINFELGNKVNFDDILEQYKQSAGE